MAKKYTAEDVFDVASFDAFNKNVLEKMKSLFTDMISSAQKKVQMNVGNNFEEIQKTVKAIEEVKKATEGLSAVEKEQLRISKLKREALEAEEGSYNQLKAQYDANQRILKSAGTATRQNSEAIKALIAENAKLYKSMSDLKNETGKWSNNLGEFKKVADIATMSLGEMKKEMMTLKRTTFTGKSTEEIKELKQRIGDLGDAMGDMQQEMKMMGTENAAVLVGGLKFISAGVEGVVGSLSLFGVESKTIEKAEKKLLALIAVTQALGEIEDVISSGKLKAIWVRTKEMVLNVKDTVQKWLNVVATSAQARAEANLAVMKGKASLATKAATSIQWLWNAALAANPIGVILIAVAALATGIGVLVYALSSSEKAMSKSDARAKMYKDTIGDINEGVAEEIANTKILVNAIQDTSLSESKRNEKLKELNNTLTEKGLKTVKDINDTKGLADATLNLNKVLEASIKVEVYRGKLKDLYLKQIENEQKQSGIKYLLEQYQAYAKLQGGVKGTVIEFDKWIGKAPQWLRELSGITSNQGALTSEWLSGTKVSKDLTTQIDVYLAEINKQNAIIPVTTEKIKENNKQIQKSVDLYAVSLKQMMDLDKWIRDQKIKQIGDEREQELAAWQETYNEKYEVAKDNSLLLEDLNKLNNVKKSEINKKYDDKEMQDLKDTHAKIMDENKAHWDAFFKQRDKNNEEDAAKLKKDEEAREKELAAIETYLAEVQKKKEKALDKEIDNSKKNQDRMRELAEKGSEDAQNNLAYEEANQRKLELQKEKELQKAKQQELALSIMKSYSKNLEAAGGDSSKALSATIRDATILTAFIKALPAYRQGTEDTGEFDNSGKLAVIHPHERILTKEQNLLTNGLTNWELANAATIYKKMDNANPTNWQSNEQILKKFDELKESINSKPVYMGSDYDNLTHSITQIVEQGNSIQKNHKTLSKLG